jgi:hypothetical protein
VEVAMNSENLADLLNRRDILLQSTAIMAAAGMTAGATLPVLAEAHDEQAAAKINPAQTKALEDWSYALAVSAATWGSPLVIMYALRNNDAVGASVKAKPNDVWRMENITTPETAQAEGYVCPNCSTIYGFGFLDLRQEPVVLHLPDSNGRYYMVETVDMWTNAFAYPAGLENGYKGGKVAYVGPNWEGELPADLKRIDAPTPWVLIQPRIHLPNPSEIAAARQVLAGI